MLKSIHFLAGLMVGLFSMGLTTWLVMPSVMLNVQESRLPFEETVQALKKASIERGWKVPKIYDIAAGCRKDGYKDLSKLKIISLCHTGHANNILKSDRDKRVAAVMPCRIGVYEDGKGRVFVSGMNLGVMGRMFGGNIATVMSAVAREEHEILASVVE